MERFWSPRSRRASEFADLSSGSTAPRLSSSLVQTAMSSPGRQPYNAELSSLRPRLGLDFSQVRIHADRPADAAARALGARAFTFGQDIYFRENAYDPRGAAGRGLLAHELVHVSQQAGRSPWIQRSPEGESTDPLCASFDLAASTAEVDARVAAWATSKAEVDRLALVRALKVIRRCATPEQQTTILTSMTTTLGDPAKAVWAESGKALGGYVGMYPGYAPDLKQRLETLGVSGTTEFSSFAVSNDLSTTGQSTQRSRAKAAATAEDADLARTDILYFRGHQYAQYGAPGVFTNIESSAAVDLRYIEKVGGYGNVKLLISTSCATLCKEAFDVFHRVFPNAVILGYRKSAPIDGAEVRQDFGRQIVGLQKPLLLDQAPDMSAIIGVWKTIIEARYQGDTHRFPAYYDGSKLTYWDGTMWKDDLAPSGTENACKVKGDSTSFFPAP